MGGKQSKDITKVVIENEIKTQITNDTKNITDILNQTITNTSMEVVGKIAQDISSNTGGGGTINISDLTASGPGSIFNLTQTVNVNAINKAASDVLQDNKQRDELINKLNQEVMNKIQNDTNMSQALEATAKLQKTVDTAGGLADMANTVKDMVTAMLPNIGDVMTTDKETTIKTKIQVNVTNMTLNSNTIKSIVQNNIKNSIKNMTTASCKMDTTSFLEINANKIVIKDGAQVNVNQASNVTSLNTCILGAKQISDLTNTIITDQNALTKSDTGTSTKVSQSAESDGSLTDTKKTNDALGQMLSSIVKSLSPFAMIAQLGTIAGIICLVCCLIIALMILLPMFKSSD